MALGAIAVEQSDYITKMQQADQAENRSLGQLEQRVNQSTAGGKAEREKLQQQLDDSTKEAYRSDDDAANSWFKAQSVQLQAIHQEVVSHMRQCKPTVWVPRYIEEDRGIFNQAIDKASKGAAFADLEKKTINKERFDDLRKYFEDISKQLEECPDT